MSDNSKSGQGSAGSFGSGSGGYQYAPLFEVGSLISYTYEVVSLVARGGMGEVYRTRHTEIGTEHAIKIVRPDLANSEKIMELFRREASVLRTVRDEAIVGYDGVLRDEEGRVYLVMEFVDGPSLTTFLKERVLTLEEVRGLRDRLARGLAAAHDRGVIHRDMSPDNVILHQGDLAQAKIIDFGIAKLADSSATTIIGDDFAGRYAYASPEQIGLYGGHVDARSDIYSLGLVLATAAAGKALNMGEISESLVSVIEARKRVPDFSSVPPELRPELGTMLEPDPAHRPQSMREVIGLDQRLREAEAAKAAAAAAQPAPATGPAPAAPLAAEPAARPSADSARRRWLMPAMAAGIAVIAAGGYVAWQQTASPPGAPVAATPAAPAPQPAAEPPAPTALAEAPAASGASGEVAPANGPATAPSAAEAQAAAEAKAAEEEAGLAAEAKAAEEARLAAEEEARRVAEEKAAEEARLAAEAQAAEEARQAAEAEARRIAEAKAAEEARLAAEAKAAEEARLAAEAKAAEEARRAAEAKAAEEARLEEARQAAEEEARRTAEAKAADEEARLAAEAKAAEEARLAAEAEARRVAEAKAAEEARLAAEAKAAEEAQLAAAAQPQEEQVAALPDAGQTDAALEAEQRLAGLKAAEAALSADERREIQRDLRALGHYSGGIDGNFGPGTRRAIESYQKVAGAETTGYLVPETRAALAEEAAPARAEAERLAAERAAAEREAAEQQASLAAAVKAAAERAAANNQGAAGQAQQGSQPAAEDQPTIGATLQAALPNESETDRLIRLAKGGDVLAQASLGQRYYRGDGVQRDYDEAVRWTRAAAEQGEPRAQSNLGFYYMKGEGVDRNPAEAARWWRAAADQGLPQAQFNLGMLYEQGEGVSVDYAEAAKWYSRAAEQGDRNARSRLDNLRRRNLIPASN